jgi:hypothetical protein
MSRKNWTSKHSREQSDLIMEVQPWQYSTGPRSAEGKSRSRMNAITHGFNTKMLREFRKSNRRKEVKEFENLCRELHKLAKAGDMFKMLPVADQLEAKFQELSEDYTQKEISPEMQMEALHTNIMMLKTMTYAIRKEAMSLCSEIFEN